MVEKVLIWNQIFEMEILINLHVLRSPESENHIFSGQSLSLSLCVCAISITQKQITAECSNLVSCVDAT